MLALLANKTFLALAAALGYALSTVLIKEFAETSGQVVLALLTAVLIGTVVAEIYLLRQVDLALAYIAIIATESLLVLCYAFFIGEGLTMREMAGAAFVLTGVALVSF